MSTARADTISSSGGCLSVRKHERTSGVTPRRRFRSRPGSGRQSRSVDVRRLGHKGPGDPKSGLDELRERSHAESLGRVVRARDEIDLPLLRVHPRVHRDLAGDVSVGAAGRRLLDEGRERCAAARDRDDTEPLAVLVRLDQRAKSRAQAVDELLECSAAGADHPGHAAVVRKEPLANLYARRLGDAITVRDAGSSIERGVGAVERDPVLPKPRVLLLDELEVDLGPASVMNDEEIGLRALGARDRVKRRAHGRRDGRDDVRRADDQAVRLLLVELRDLETLVEEPNDVVEADVSVHAMRSVRIRFTIAGFALLPSRFMTGPTSAPRARTLPRL